MVKQFLFVGLFLSILTVACSQIPSKIDDMKYQGTESVGEYFKNKDYSKYSTAIFAGGCFWCNEAQFHRILGVVDVISGYSGGDEPNPDYYGVGAGKTGHAEAIYIVYDDSVISYEKLLEIFFVGHDPTQLNRQGPDVGPEYRSAIYYQTEDEMNLVLNYIKKLNASKKYSKKIVTEVARYKEFWVAEKEHQNYYELHPENPYVQNVSKKKVDKVINTFPELLKPEYRN